MRHVILSGDKKATGECTFEAGKYLSQLRKITLPRSGFFNVDMIIRKFQPESD